MVGKMLGLESGGRLKSYSAYQPLVAWFGVAVDRHTPRRRGTYFLEVLHCGAPGQNYSGRTPADCLGGLASWNESDSPETSPMDEFLAHPFHLRWRDLAKFFDSLDFSYWGHIDFSAEIKLLAKYVFPRHDMQGRERSFVLGEDSFRLLKQWVEFALASSALQTCGRVVKTYHSPENDSLAQGLSEKLFVVTTPEVPPPPATAAVGDYVAAPQQMIQGSLQQSSRVLLATESVRSTNCRERLRAVSKRADETAQRIVNRRCAGATRPAWIATLEAAKRGFDDGGVNFLGVEGIFGGVNDKYLKDQAIVDADGYPYEQDPFVPYSFAARLSSCRDVVASHGESLALSELMPTLRLNFDEALTPWWVEALFRGPRDPDTSWQGCLWDILHVPLMSLSCDQEVRLVDPTTAAATLSAKTVPAAGGSIPPTQIIDLNPVSYSGMSVVSDANGVCADAAVNGDAEVDCSSEDYDVLDVTPLSELEAQTSCPWIRGSEVGYLL
ncbi:unnamed protein product [Symbiodinium sp. KB8]|nr:unnamed protein product [Symbiodinium sp. KB8]